MGQSPAVRLQPLAHHMVEIAVRQHQHVMAFGRAGDQDTRGLIGADLGLGKRVDSPAVSDTIIIAPRNRTYPDIFCFRA